MKIAVIGANGHIGSRVVQEALNRGHDVTAVVRTPSKVQTEHEHLKVVQGDALDTQSIVNAIKGQDVVVSAYGTGYGPDSDPSNFPKAAQHLIDAVKQAGVPRLLWVGGAASLEVAPGVQLIDTEEFPAEWKAGAAGQRDALHVFRQSDINWTYMSPAFFIEPGTRTGKYRTGGDQVVRDAEGKSYISTEDYAVALLDELETPKHLRQRFTVAY